MKKGERYEEDGVVIHCGDARDVLPSLDLDPARTVVITDPVWPNAPPGLFDVADPADLFASVAAHFPRLARRVVVQLGCASDPRFLLGVPASFPFVRACWLRYARPSYAGTVLNSGDVAYVFGSHEGPQGRTILPGECTATTTHRETDAHPCPRKLAHLRFLVGNLSREGDTILDPFCGSGTTLLAAKGAGRRAVGVDVSPAFCVEARRRLAQRVLTGRGAAGGESHPPKVATIQTILRSCDREPEFTLSPKDAER